MKSRRPRFHPTPPPHTLPVLPHRLHQLPPPFIRLRPQLGRLHSPVVRVRVQPRRPARRRRRRPKYNRHRSRKKNRRRHLRNNLNKRSPVQEQRRLLQRTLHLHNSSRRLHQHQQSKHLSSRLQLQLLSPLSPRPHRLNPYQLLVSVINPSHLSR